MFASGWRAAHRLAKLLVGGDRSPSRAMPCPGVLYKRDELVAGAWVPRDRDLIGIPASRPDGAVAVEALSQSLDDKIDRWTGMPEFRSVALPDHDLFG